MRGARRWWRSAWFLRTLAAPRHVLCLRVGVIAAVRVAGDRGRVRVTASPRMHRQLELLQALAQEHRISTPVRRRQRADERSAASMRCSGRGRVRVWLWQKSTLRRAVATAKACDSCATRAEIELKSLSSFVRESPQQQRVTSQGQRWFVLKDRGARKRGDGVGKSELRMCHQRPGQ